MYYMCVLIKLLYISKSNKGNLLVIFQIGQRMFVSIRPGDDSCRYFSYIRLRTWNVSLM